MAEDLSELTSLDTSELISELMSLLLALDTSELTSLEASELTSELKSLDVAELKPLLGALEL